MAILIKGMEMPDSCDVCDMVEVNDNLGLLSCKFTGEYVDDCIACRHEDCPIVTELPEKHGKLVQKGEKMYQINDDIPLGCIYESQDGSTKYCPMLNHDDVPYCQWFEDSPEAAIGIDERPVYCPILPSAQPEQRWIPVTKDTLPVEGKVVIVKGKTGTWDFGIYRGYSRVMGEGDIHLWNWKKNTLKRVYWWMYKDGALPEPTGGEEE